MGRREGLIVLMVLASATTVLAQPRNRPLDPSGSLDSAAVLVHERDRALRRAPAPPPTQPVVASALEQRRFTRAVLGRRSFLRLRDAVYTAADLAAVRERPFVVPSWMGPVDVLLEAREAYFRATHFENDRAALALNPLNLGLRLTLQLDEPQAQQR